MAYIQVGQSVVTHRKTLRLARLLGMDRYQVVGRLVSLWSWCLDNAPRGCLKEVEPDILADVLDYQGKPAELVEALNLSGFLDVREDGLLWVHGWDETMLPYVERKEKNAARMRNTRAREREQSEMAYALESPSGDAACVQHVQRTFTARAGVEKKREEKNISGPTVETDGGDTPRERMAPVASAALTLGALALSPAVSPAAATNVAPLPLKPIPRSAQTPIPDRPISTISKPARAPDVLWDACVAACGGNGPSNDTERGKWNKGLKSLRQSGATAEEIAVRAERYKRRYGESIPLNPMALAGNWTTLATEVHEHDGHHDGHHTTGNGNSGGSSRSDSGGRGGSSHARGAYNPQLPTAEDFQQWARERRAAGATNIIGG